VQSPRSGERVLSSVSTFLEKKLKLRINKEKSAVGQKAPIKIGRE